VVRLSRVQGEWREPPRSRLRIAHSFSQWLARSLNSFPQLKALAFAAWFADDSLFSQTFLDWHRRTGLSHALAVSGQHVVLLAVGLRLSFRLAMVPYYFLFSSTKAMFWLLELAQVLAACVYLLLCPMEGSVWRATSAALWVSVLRCLHWHSQSLQVFCSILALALCLEPGSVLNWGFVLSSAGTFLLFSAHSLWKSYLAVSLLLPLAMLPLQLHFFWMWDWATCLHAVAFCWLWAGVWIPLAFVVPVLAALPHCEKVLGWAEEGFAAFSYWVVHCPTWSHVAVRPSFWEAVAWTCLGVGVAGALPPFYKRLKRVFRAWGYALKLAAPCIDFRRKTVWNK
jgi:ComEC/Rec2-related protein